MLSNRSVRDGGYVLVRPLGWAIALGLGLWALPGYPHAGHGHGFSGGDTSSEAMPKGMAIDPALVQRLGWRVEPATRRSLGVGLRVPGQIMALPGDITQVTAPATGKVLELLVKPGDRVRRGQVLAVLTSAELVGLRTEALDRDLEARSALARARVNLAAAARNRQRQRAIAQAERTAARTQLSVAQERYERDRDLATLGALPRRQALESRDRLAESEADLAKVAGRLDLLQAETEWERAQADLIAAEQHLKLSSTSYRARLAQLGAQADRQGRITVLAPSDGVVTQVHSSAGETVEEATKGLLELARLDRVLVKAQVYERDLARVRRGQPVMVRVAGQDDRPLRGQVSRLGTTIDPETRALPVEAILTNPGETLKLGAFATIDLIVGQGQPVLALPMAAIVQEGNRSIVFVQNGNQFQATEVSLGANDGAWVEIQRGLFEGDRVVTQGATQLYAESRRSGSGGHAEEAEAPAAATSTPTAAPLAWGWLAAAGGGGFLLGAGGVWLTLRWRDRQITAMTPALEPLLLDAPEPRERERAIDSRP